MSSREYARVLILAAGPAEVYRTVATPEGMVRWFASRVRPIAGGFHCEFDRKDGQAEGIDCFCTEQVPNRRFAFRWKSENPGHETYCSFDLAPAGAGCRLTFRTWGFGDGPEWDRALAEEASGWDVVLERLLQLLGPGPSRRVTCEGYIPAAPAQALAALVEPAVVTRLLSAEYTVDLRPGGEVRYLSPDPNGHTGRGRILEYTPGQRLRLLWHWYEEELADTEVTITVVGEGVGARMKIVHAGFGLGPEWERTYREHEQGWRDILDWLAANLQAGSCR